MKKSDLIIDLSKRLRSIEHDFEILLSKDNLAAKPDGKSWSVLECVEHLNIINAFYLNELEKTFQKHRTIAKEETLNSTFLGRFMNRLMTPKERVVQYKMNTFRQFNPICSTLVTRNVIHEFELQLSRLAELLKESQSKSIYELKIKSAISGFVRFNVSDAFQFLIGHIERHLIQAKKVSKLSENDN